MSGKVLGERLETPRRQSGDLEIQGIVVVKMPSDVEVMALGVGVKVMVDVVIDLDLGRAGRIGSDWGKNKDVHIRDGRHLR